MIHPDLKKGKFSPTLKELEEAREKGGEEAVKKLKERYKQATERMREEYDIEKEKNIKRVRTNIKEV